MDRGEQGIEERKVGEASRGRGEKKKDEKRRGERTGYRQNGMRFVLEILELATLRMVLPGAGMY